MAPRLRNKEEQKFTNNQLLEEVAINLQKIPFELQRKEFLKTSIRYFLFCIWYMLKFKAYNLSTS